ncbi:MAG: long-chain fatty acid--CoA ligase [Anaerolineae bacterium]|nr:long-chain fatty acid--CoA ligase [Anaerolineae bacterium]
MDKPWFQHYDSHVPHTIDYPDITLDQALTNSTLKSPDAVATIIKGGKLTYTQLDAQVDRLAAALQQLGVKKGDRVAIHLPNSPQFVIGYYAALRIGAIAVPCNSTYVARELEYQLNDSGAETLITFSAFYEMVKSIRAQTPLKRVIVAKIQSYFPSLLKIIFTLLLEKKRGYYADISGDAQTYWFQDVLKSAPAKPTPVQKALDDTAVLMYTGGTTGVSKGAQLSHRNLVCNTLQCSHWLNTINRPPKMLTALPLYHSYAMTSCMNHAIYTGGSMILVPNPRDLKDVLETIDKFKPTIYPGVPAMYVAINNSPDVAAGKYDVSSIEACMSGAAGLPGEVQERFQKITGASLVEGYGLSEASPVTHVNPVFDGNNRIGYIGLPLPDTDARIVDVETGEQELAPGEVGELCIRGPQVMKGYWNMPTETENMLRNGWLYTGDIVVMTKDGFFQIQDRKKDMILGAGGYNVYPREIEEVLYQHPKVKEVVAAGIQVEERGERPKVWIVLKEGETATEEEILAFCEENLAPYKRPRFVEFRDDLPKTMVGKVLRRELIRQEIEK